jgi:hypothetical protein
MGQSIYFFTAAAFAVLCALVYMERLTTCAQTQTAAVILTVSITTQSVTM